ncbi:Glycosyltransferase [Candidatus Burkholderia verschuerenii]|uniref:Glycosyltransferase n=2 Tax=Candidatus Burkholderia verschuerenii TaxID=242163 RepID=A0A0L0MEI6_9BURK|nr:Glycosyltransferase [Candidatus Burkholderia verschuerenii]
MRVLSQVETVGDGEQDFDPVHSGIAFMAPACVPPIPSWNGLIPFAFWLVEAQKPESIVELGTHRGNSYLAFCQAVRKLELPTRCHAIDTWRGDSHAGFYDDSIYTTLAAYHDPLYGDFSRLIRTTFDDAVSYFSDGSIDLLHIDGLHTYDAVRHDFETWLPRLSDRAVVLFHDIAVREREFGVWKFWEEISARYPSFTFAHSNGLGLLAVGRDQSAGVRWLTETVAKSPKATQEIREYFGRLGTAVSSSLDAQLQREALGERDASIARVTGEVEQTRELIGKLEAAVGDRDQWLIAANAQRDHLRVHGESLEQALKQHAVALDAQKNLVARARDEFSTGITERDERLTQQEELLAQQEERLAQQEERLIEQSALLMEQMRRGADRDVLVERLNAIESSTIWRASRPVRSFLGGSRAYRFLRHPRQYLVARGRSSKVLRRVGDTVMVRRLRMRVPADLNKFFNPHWYLQRNPDVQAAGVDPLMHYLRAGARERRDPSVEFSTNWYLTNNPDVRAAGANPLAHFLLHGRAEGRLPRPLAGVQFGEIAPISAKAATELGKWLELLPDTDTTTGAPLARSSAHDPYESWRSVNTLSVADIRELRKALSEHADRLPKISIITPIYDTPPELFAELEAAVRNQIYGNWEWCLANDCSPAPHVRPMLDRLQALDGRIKVVHLEENGGISVATNAAVGIATGEIIAFVDHDDLITPDCVAELALYYAEHSDSDVVYSDDDKIDLSGRHFAPQFKPDWSPVLLLSYMYFGHVFSVRRALFEELGGFRKPFDGSQDYDFALRATEKARHVGHVPKILYNWRVVPGSTAASGDAKPASLEAGRMAVEQAVERRGIAGARVTHPAWARAAKVGMFDIEFRDDGPDVSIIIPTKNHAALLKTCIESLAKTTYVNYEVLMIDNDSNEPDAIAYLRELSTRPRHRVVRIPSEGGRFSFAGLMNKAVKHANTDYLLFLNNDTEVISEHWLSAMMGYAQMDRVGAVGARLYFEDGTIQHAGIVHGYHEGLVGHAFRNKAPHDWGYMGFIRTPREYSAVTAACMVTPRKLFDEVGGFDETDFAVAYNDVDYCYRLIKAGWNCVYASQAELLHFESKSRGYKDSPVEVANLRRKYGDWTDRWYNRNLSLENEWFEPATVRWPSRDQSPVHVLLVTHNLNFEGAPIFLFDLAKGLMEHGAITASVVSPQDGPLRQLYASAGIPVHVLSDPVAAMQDAHDILETLATIGRVFKSLKAEVVVANTLNAFWAVAGATAGGIPSIWCQHESEPWATYFDYLPPRARAVAYGAFAQAYRVTYVAEATRRGWRDVETNGNFRLIRYGIAPERLAEETGRWSRESARNELKIAPDDIVLVVVGTVCRRKGQLDVVEALAKMSAAVTGRIRLYIAGKTGEVNYTEQIEAAISRLPSALTKRVVLTGPMEDPFLYYRAADVYICSSHIESAPRVLVEAMACGLPIVTTPVFGIREQVKEDINALFYEAGDTAQLAERLERIIADEALRERLRSKSFAVLDSLPGYEEMIVKYTQAIREAKPLNLSTQAPGITASTIF